MTGNEIANAVSPIFNELTAGIIIATIIIVTIGLLIKKFKK